MLYTQALYDAFKEVLNKTTPGYNFNVVRDEAATTQLAYDLNERFNNGWSGKTIIHESFKDSFMGILSDNRVEYLKASCVSPSKEWSLIFIWALPLEYHLIQMNSEVNLIRADLELEPISIFDYLDQFEFSLTYRPQTGE